MAKKSTTKTSKTVVKITKTGDDSEKPNVVKNTKKDTEEHKKPLDESTELEKKSTKKAPEKPAKKHVIASELSRVKRNKKQKVVDGPRWYHILALAVVLALAGFAAYKIISRFDLSLMGAEHTVDIYYGCAQADEWGLVDTDDLRFRSYGIHVGDKFGKNGVTADEESAYVKIVKFEKDYAIISRRSDYNDWAERSIDYGVQQGVNLEQHEEACTEALYFTIY